MVLIETKKAAAIIATFSKREKELYRVSVEYINEDMQHIINCDKEIKVYQNSNPEKYRNAIDRQTQLSFRAKYILQCLGIYVHDNFDTKSIEVKTLDDK